ncbi:MAG: inositol monophosphatase [Pirellulaceae bacterium]|nr:MAG: inositol monophosphatase [Pirellulaceae bacterium]
MSSENTFAGAMDAACDAARAAGRILRDRLGKVAAKEKAPADLVTEADTAAQAAIADIVRSRFPRYAFLGEESPPQQREEAAASGAPLWIVDPLDGTANYVHRLGGFSVSIALCVEGQPRLGVVFDPLANVMYKAQVGGRATKNGRPLSVSGCSQLRSAMVCCSFRPGVRRSDPEVDQFLNILESAQTIRRLGSAALNLCYLAEGCLDAYWATSVKVWDVAAGYLIAHLAGAHITNPEGEPFDLWHPRLLATASNELHEELLCCLHTTEKLR